ncbi:4-(cytidine 5'-diphospho)-2-C-methyl-D-erythritol kinase [Kordiimonas pumila]|uniref:4-diphosphocytidyl-2-C-methyl-D-erythritol kinase n=1 Tax=Kordiimonas pumila TaxID=2161677 RepID=A0ABV7D7C6_9PROT|nr:4-(cytidine 5'-diphospho)-2-C-methyl-D-erythritol kinase [Kordiimonas pumila]
MPYVTRYLDDSITVNAPAKLNLFLHITGRRPNGYHELESLFAFTKQGDKIHIKQSDLPGFRVEGLFAKHLKGLDPKENLVLKAATILAEYAARPLDVTICLEKNLPVASGIGGGSADAAATLLALDAFWGLDCNKNFLESLALQLGADVPACLYNVPLYVTGIGECMAPADLPKQYGVVLINPGVALSTPAVFKAYRAQAKQFDAPMGRVLPKDSFRFIEFLKAKTHNSLLAASKTLCPEIVAVLSLLKQDKQALYVQMSGSGATCFALYNTQKEADSAARRIRALMPSWWVMADTLSL